MLDPNLLRSQLNQTAEQLQRLRSFDLPVDELANLESERKRLQTQTQELQASRNRLCTAEGRGEGRNSSSGVGAGKAAPAPVAVTCRLEELKIVMPSTSHIRPVTVTISPTWP
ncbi:MAG: hypothetical protein KDC66_20620 [Phaeodactylibacter sp.]|nr:hypothetical protein [Phaeodactylibacter sp.]